MRMKKTINFLILLVLIPIAFAFVCKVDEVCNVRIPCTYHDNLCPSDMECRMDIYNTNGNLLINYALMTYNKTNYNYSYEFTSLGQYRSFVQCNNTNINASTSFDIDVVKKDMLLGNISQESETRTIIILISLIVIFLILGIYFNTLGSQFKYLFFMLAVVFIDALAYFGYHIMDGINS